jgi:hypothetical protein
MRDTFADLKALADDTVIEVRLVHDTRLASLVLLETLIRVYAQAKLEVLEDLERGGGDKQSLGTSDTVGNGGPHGSTHAQTPIG